MSETPSTLVASLAEAEAGTLQTFQSKSEFENALKDTWAAEPRPRLLYMVVDSACEEDISYAIPEPTPWSIAFTPTFRKSIASVDKKLQGRVLSALSALSESPIRPHGDTIKQLVGDLAGLWRYRVGDYRLIYKPRRDSRTVVLLDFAARGGVYD